MPSIKSKLLRGTMKSVKPIITGMNIPDQRKGMDLLRYIHPRPKTVAIEPVEELSLIHIYLEYLGVKVDEEKNLVHGVEREIPTSDSTVRGFVIPTNEELVIARDTKALVEEM